MPLSWCFSLTTSSTFLTLRIYSVWKNSSSTAHTAVGIKYARKRLWLFKGWFLDNWRDNLRLNNGWQLLLLNFWSLGWCPFCHQDAFPWWFLVTSHTHQSLLNSICNIRIPAIWAVRTSHQALLRHFRILISKRWGTTDFLDLNCSWRGHNFHCFFIWSCCCLLIRLKLIPARWLNWLLGWWFHDTEMKHNRLFRRLSCLLDLIKLSNLLNLNRVIAWTRLFFASLWLRRSLSSNIHRDIFTFMFLSCLWFLERTYSFIRYWFSPRFDRWWFFIWCCRETWYVSTIVWVLVFVINLLDFISLILPNRSDLIWLLSTIIIKVTYHFLFVCVFSPDNCIVLSLKSTWDRCSCICHWRMANIVSVKSNWCLKDHTVCLWIQIHIIVDQMRSHQVFSLILYLRLDKHRRMLILSLINCICLGC